jgi:hypothetical protein
MAIDNIDQPIATEKEWKGDTTSNPQKFLDDFIKSDVFNNGYEDIQRNKVVQGYKSFSDTIDKRGENISQSEKLEGFLSSEKAHFLLREYAKEKCMLVTGPDTPQKVMNRYELYKEALEKAKRGGETPKPLPGESKEAFEERLDQWKQSKVEDVYLKEKERASLHSKAAAALQNSVRLDANDPEAKIPSNFARAMVALLAASNGLGNMQDVIGCWENLGRQAQIEFKENYDD